MRLLSRIASDCCTRTMPSSSGPATVASRRISSIGTPRVMSPPKSTSTSSPDRTSSGGTFPEMPCTIQRESRRSAHCSDAVSTRRVVMASATPGFDKIAPTIVSEGPSSMTIRRVASAPAASRCGVSWSPKFSKNRSLSSASKYVIRSVVSGACCVSVRARTRSAPWRRLARTIQKPATWLVDAWVRSGKPCLAAPGSGREVVSIARGEIQVKHY